jgi:L-2,4-diaminobutyrate decarboxylase
MNDAMARALDPETFRAAGHRLIDRLADYLGAAARGGMPVLPPGDPGDRILGWPAQFDTGGTDFNDLISRAIVESNHLHHPGYVGHQVTAPLPSAALCELVAALLNNSMAVYEMGPASTAMERAVVGWLAGRLGLPAGADGVLTSGGSLGNLTALLAARQAKAGYDAWRLGAEGQPPLAVLVSTEAHYSVARAVRIMGWGEGGVQPVPVDERFRLRVDALESALAAAHQRGRRPIAVVASAASTATGAFDPLDPIADFCQAHDLWLHVDGAHGAAAVLSERHRTRVVGIERADSVVWDAHKMMLMPALVSAVLFREARHSYQAFRQEASYLFSERPPELDWFDIGQRTIECTKRMMSLKVYVALAVYGGAFFGDYVATTFDLAAEFARLIDEAPDFELAVAPECNIVCFRYRPLGAEDLDGLQARVRERLLREGSFYLVHTRLPAGRFLRTTLINPRTTEADLRALLDRIRVVGRAA